MSNIRLFSALDREKFDAPPNLKKEERGNYFEIDVKTKRYLHQLRSPVSKVGFLLQLGYFRANAKFYDTDSFRPYDIRYLKSKLNIEADINFAEYGRAVNLEHRLRILQTMKWNAYDTQNSRLELMNCAKSQVQQQARPVQIFNALLDYCWLNTIEVPSYYEMTRIITDSYNLYEEQKCEEIKQLISPEQARLLDELLNVQNVTHSPLAKFKRIEQSTKPMKIKESVATFEQIQKLYESIKNIDEKLALSDAAVTYFAKWVKKSKLLQMLQFEDPNKRYFYLIAFIRYQYFIRHDALIDCFIKMVSKYENRAKLANSQAEKGNRKEVKKAIKTIIKSRASLAELVDSIIVIIKNTQDSDHAKLNHLEALVDKFIEQTPEEKKKIISLAVDQLTSNADQTIYYNTLAESSIKLQRRVSGILKAMRFNEAVSQENLTAAVNHFRQTDGDLSARPPMAFLTLAEREMVMPEKTLKTSLYKALFFIHVTEGIRSGKLNLTFSYRFKAIHEYLIANERWQAERWHLLAAAGLTEYADGSQTLFKLAAKLDKAFHATNKRFTAGENPHISISKEGHVSVSTPKIDSDDSKFISNTLSRTGHIPVLQLLREIDAACSFTPCFHHFSNKNNRMNPSQDTILAGILGKGCNIGLGKLVNISIGIKEDTLQNVVNWCFELKNIQTANKRILSHIYKLSMANAYKRNPKMLHTSSDGKKMSVAVDSLSATYSYKYFGKEKGVSIYTFIDERQALFHNTVISASDREAAFVLDGLMENDVEEKMIHSTDTHGYTESVFGVTHLLDIAFAPRIKDLGSQDIYSFSTRSSYKKSEYSILPQKRINRKLILAHWDEILQFVATIKLKHTTASQLFSRLSSYAEDHPLYKALKEFGRIRVKTNKQHFSRLINDDNQVKS